jgi:hypothetical protein
MPKQSQSVRAESQSGVILCPETINSITEKLQDLTQTFLDLDQANSMGAAPREIPPKQKEADQIRCYRVPGHIVEDEREALNVHQAKNILDFLQKARDEFQITSFLLRNFDDCTTVSGGTLQQIGEHLDRPIDMLTWLCSIFADYHPQSLVEESLSSS